MKRVTGYIPKSVTAVCAPEEEVKDFNGRTISVAYAKVTDTDKTKLIAAATNELLNWKDVEPAALVSDNVSVSGMQIVKVMDPSQYGSYMVTQGFGKEVIYHELSHNTLMEAMLNAGIQSGGWINGDFIWACISSKMQPVRVGSDTYNQLLEQTAARDNTVLGPADFTPGGVYVGRDNKRMLFLGFVHTKEWDGAEWAPVQKQVWLNLYHWRAPAHSNEVMFNLMSGEGTGRWPTWRDIAFLAPKSLRLQVDAIELPGDLFGFLKREAVKGTLGNMDWYSDKPLIGKNERLRRLAARGLRWILIEEGSVVPVPRKLQKYLDKPKLMAGLSKEDYE